MVQIKTATDFSRMGYSFEPVFNPTHPNLNNSMTQEQRIAFDAYMRGEEVAFTPDGTPYIPEQLTSDQTVEQYIGLLAVREENLGSWFILN